MAIEPEALDVSAAMLSGKEPASARMRKNMWALRSRVMPSHAPIVRVKDSDTGYAWDTKAGVSDDVKLERRLKGRTARQLMKLRQRCTKRAARIEKKADKVVAPRMATELRNVAERLRNVASSADCELRFERWGESTFKNQDGN